jgi:CO/xanthine dehydrogenase Mo-binding subunit
MINGNALLQATGTLVVTFSLTRRRAAPGPAGPAKALSRGRVDGFLALDIDGSVLVYSGKVDLGADVRSAFARIVADELDLPMARVTVVQGDRALTPDQGPASESLFIRNGGNQLRRAAATARRALLEKAATQLDCDASMLAIRDGVVIARNERDDGRKLPLGTLVGGMSLALTLDDDAPRKTPAGYIRGKPAPGSTRTAM